MPVHPLQHPIAPGLQRDVEVANYLRMPPKAGEELLVELAFLDGGNPYPKQPWDFGAKGIEKVVFDRGGYIYTGRVAALADGAREAGLKF